MADGDTSCETGNAAVRGTSEIGLDAERHVTRTPNQGRLILIEPEPMRVVVSAGGKIVAATERALRLKEGSYPTVIYIPRADIDLHSFDRSEHRTYCPYKGECTYFDLVVNNERRRNVAWSYEEPVEGVAAIRNYVAFYPDRVDEISLHST